MSKKLKVIRAGGIKTKSIRHGDVAMPGPIPQDPSMEGKTITVVDGKLVAVKKGKASC